MAYKLESFKDIVDLAVERCKLKNPASEIVNIIQSAINQCYLELQKKEPIIDKNIVVAVNGMIDLPEDLNEIISISPQLSINDKKIGKKIITELTGSFNIVYSKFLDPLVNDTDIPEISTKYFYSMSTYACYAYYTYKKKNNEAVSFYNDYLQSIQILGGTGNPQKKVVNSYASIIKEGVNNG